MIQYLGCNATDNTVTFAIEGKRWEYWLNANERFSVDYLAHKVSSRKALVHARLHATKSERISS